MRIIVGCRHALLREGIRELLRRWSNLELVGEAPSPSDAAILAEKHQPDILLLARGDDPHEDAAGIKLVRRRAKGCKVVLIDSALRRGRRDTLDVDGRAGRGVGSAGLVRLLWETHGGKAPAHTKSGAPGGPEGKPHQLLTDREYEVARAVCRGLANKTIARKLRISEKTVKNHLSSIYRRTGISGRTQLVIWAMRNGLITADEAPRDD